MQSRRAYDRKFDLAALDKLKSMGVNLIPVELPHLPYGAITPVLEAEAAAAFDDLTMTGRDALLTEQIRPRLAQHLPHRALLSCRRIHPGHARAYAGRSASVGAV